jgi:hypothetical protein
MCIGRFECGGVGYEIMSLSLCVISGEIFGYVCDWSGVRLYITAKK